MENLTRHGCASRCVLTCHSDSDVQNILIQLLQCNCWIATVVEQCSNCCYNKCCYSKCCNAIVSVAIVAMGSVAYIESWHFCLIVSWVCLFVCCLSFSELPSVNIDHVVEQLSLWPSGMGWQNITISRCSGYILLYSSQPNEDIAKGWNKNQLRQLSRTDWCTVDGFTVENGMCRVVSRWCSWNVPRLVKWSVTDFS